MSVSLALSWLLFLALFPLAFFWLRRAWRIIARRDYDEVALKGGEPPSNPGKFAPYSAAVNLLAGLTAAILILLVIAGFISYDKWTAVAGTTLWLKLIADFIISRHAHAGVKQKKA